MSTRPVLLGLHNCESCRVSELKRLKTTTQGGCRALGSHSQMKLLAYGLIVSLAMMVVEL